MEVDIQKLIREKGLTAPRVTPEDVERAIRAEYYFTADSAVEQADPALRFLTFCVLVLQNGFTVTGESACASPENFDAETGKSAARNNAVKKIWSLLGYSLREKLHLESTTTEGLKNGNKSSRTAD